MSLFCVFLNYDIFPVCVIVLCVVMICVNVLCLMQMSSSSASSHTEEDGGTDTDDDFMVVYLALQSIDGHDGSGTNKKTRSLPLETGIQWVERQLLDSDDCYDMFRMRRTVFRMLHETLVNEYGLTST